ncbi:hypothetical protein BU23DRAFT_554536 [Bimuria novae-zelandiae CBS 107.79]|uniref:Uncharacterized protein n=1 Tax=Bimuria novae-zelandiae CBS 107.79 TaxID=1447943 RepID=A0A6A5V6D1_9PLEO|nr:hypothetical protein BU23DRAFT_554536 [Bimuria novae-zelandiae CBS 107.79]
MHASLILLVASVAASAVAAPMPIQSPAESPEPLKVRDVDEDNIIPAVENLKREILERLDTIVLRSIPDHGRNQNFELSNGKRRLASGATGAEPNYKRDARDQNVGGSWQKRDARVYDHSGVNKRDRSLRTSKPTYKRAHSYGNGGVNYRRDAREYSGPSANYKREARQYSGPSANYKREPEARQYSGPSANYKREAEARQYSGPSANYRRDFVETDVDDE